MVVWEASLVLKSCDVYTFPANADADADPAPDPIGGIVVEECMPKGGSCADDRLSSRIGAIEERIWEGVAE